MEIAGANDDRGDPAPSVRAPASCRLERLGELTADLLDASAAVTSFDSAVPCHLCEVGPVRVNPGDILGVVAARRESIGHATSVIGPLPLAATGAATPDALVAIRPLREPGSDRVVGALSVIDDCERRYSEREIRRLDDLAVAVESEYNRTSTHARVALDALSQGVVLVNRRGEILDENAAARALIGGPIAQHFGPDGAWALSDHEGRPFGPGASPIYHALVHGERLNGVIVSWRRNDNELAVGSVSVEPDPLTGNSVISFVDVTGEYRARRHYDSVLEMVHVGFVTFDRDGVIRQVNPGFERQTLRSARSLVGAPLATLFEDPGIQAQISRNVFELLGDEWGPGTHSLVSLEGQVTRSDGRPMWLGGEMTVLDADEGLGVLSTHDVTERRRFINRLSRYEQLFHHSNDLIYIIDRTGVVRYASPSNSATLGYTDAAQFDEQMVHPDDRAAMRAALSNLFHHIGEGEPFTIRVRTYDGDWRFLECVGSNLLDEPSVDGIVITCRDATERHQLTTELEHRASHDGLTDLLNRQSFDAYLEAALARSLPSGRPIAVAYIDLDGFKAVNDTLGHAFGDRVLMQMSERLAASVRASDLAARIGGDEFAVLLEPVDVAEIEAFVQRIRDELVAPLQGSLAGIRCGASVGLALSVPGDSASSLMRRADAAMYRAKRLQGNTVEVAVVTPHNSDSANDAVADVRDDAIADLR